MKVIVQRYAGMNARNCSIWVDTHFESLEDANRMQPEFYYRAIATDGPAERIVPYWADTTTVGLKPCCKRHAA